ncbi:Protein LAZ1-like 2 [Vitis vinifera]|uniref:Protein LAZ1-like 2 n=1 Tax=Vitis vinifera TaxID=29760 RepID=A0A438E903_VITVI|nr:Protein LAZ1-like 2 [Vitis vinifera]
MILKTVCAFLAFVLELFGVYGDGEFKWRYGYPYMAVVLNFSQMWALFCLVQFYNVTHGRLQSIKPLAKFISFQGYCVCYMVARCGYCIVVFTWSLAQAGEVSNWFAGLLNMHRSKPLLYAIHDDHTGLSMIPQMAIAAVAHVFVFSAEPYRFLPASEYEEVTTETTIAEVNSHTLFRLFSKQVVKDVVLTINQAIEPVERGVTKIQETFHQISVGSGKEEDTELVLEKQEHDHKNLTESEENLPGSLDLKKM